MRSKTTAAACTDVLLPRATTRLVPSAAPHVHGQHRHRGSGAVAAATAANTTDLLSIAAAAAYTFSYFYFFSILSTLYVARRTRLRRRGSSRRFTRAAHTYYTHVLYTTDIIIFKYLSSLYCNNNNHYTSFYLFYCYYYYYFIHHRNIITGYRYIVVTLAPERGYGPAGQRAPGLTVF